MPVASYSAPSDPQVKPCVKAPASWGCVRTSSHDRGKPGAGVRMSHVASGKAAAGELEGVAASEPLAVEEAALDADALKLAAAVDEEEALIKGAFADAEDDADLGPAPASVVTNGDGCRDGENVVALLAADTRPNSSPMLRPNELNRPVVTMPIATAHTAAHCHDRRREMRLDCDATGVFAPFSPALSN